VSISTNLQGRLRNTRLPLKSGLFPLFEAVVNSLHAIDVSNDPSAGRITVRVQRDVPLPSLFDGDRRLQQTGDIVGFEVVDNGEGFHDKNMASFETLDSEYKAEHGCRGVGRLLWLKAFENVRVSSGYVNETGQLNERTFTFTVAAGVTEEVSPRTVFTNPGSKVELIGYQKQYREKSPKTVKTIANSLVEHCIWYFVREGGAPKIIVHDDAETIDLDAVFADYMHTSAVTESLEVEEEKFELTHVKLKASSSRPHSLVWCAANRVVQEDNISGKVPGLHGRLETALQNMFTHAMSRRHISIGTFARSALGSTWTRSRNRSLLMMVQDFKISAPPSYRAQPCILKKP
jgi:hypothetical protein